MAERVQRKAKRQSGRPVAAASASVEAGGELAARHREAERELEAARRELAAARQRIRELEAARDVVVNRIDWVIDSLTTLVDEA